LRTLAKLPVWKIEFKIQTLPQVLPLAAVEFGTIPISWFELGISYASLFEVVLASLALVYYVADMPSGKRNLIKYCQDFFN